MKLYQDCNDNDDDNELKLKVFIQIWITDLKAHEVSSKALKEDEIIKYSNLKYLCLVFPLHHPRVSCSRKTMEK